MRKIRRSSRGFPPGKDDIDLFGPFTANVLKNELYERKPTADDFGIAVRTNPASVGHMEFFRVGQFKLITKTEHCFLHNSRVIHVKTTPVEFARYTLVGCVRMRAANSWAHYSGKSERSGAIAPYPQPITAVVQRHRRRRRHPSPPQSS